MKRGLSHERIELLRGAHFACRQQLALPDHVHLIALFDLKARRHMADFSTYPYLAPHGLRWGPAGQLYCLCENSGVVLEMDAGKGSIQHIIEVGSNKAHRMEIMPDGSKLYTENEEDTFASVIDLSVRLRTFRVIRVG